MAQNKIENNLTDDSPKNPQETPTPTPELKPKAYQWVALKGGNYNRIWKSNFDVPTTLISNESYSGPWVFKLPIPSKNLILNAMSEKNRAVRLWNEINPKLPKAGLYKQGWVAPYIENTRPSTDTEIAQKMIEIFCNTRRITVDAATQGNFLTSMKTGKVILVDMDLALKRRTSKASINFDITLNERFASYWRDTHLLSTMPKTIEVTRNLLYLEDNLTPAEIDDLYIAKKINLKNIQALTWYRTKNILPFPYTVINDIDSLNALEIPLTDHILAALIKNHNKSNSVNPSIQNQSHLFFSPEKSTIVEPSNPFLQNHRK